MLMTARMTNPAFAVAGAMDALNALAKTISRARVPISQELMHLRASQINGCSVCVDMHAKAARKAGESEERVFAVAAWRETPYFSEAERAALALTEALTPPRRPGRPGTDAIWDAAAEHFDESSSARMTLICGRIGGVEERAVRAADRSRAALAVENERLQRVLRARLEEERALRRVATLVAQEHAPELVLTVVAEEVARHLGADAALIARYDTPERATVVADWSAPGLAPIPVGSQIELGSESALARVHATRAPARVDSYEGMPGEYPAQLRALGMRASSPHQCSSTASSGARSRQAPRRALSAPTQRLVSGRSPSSSRRRLRTSTRGSSSARPAPASSKPPMRLAAGSSAICTTVPSSASSASRCRCGWQPRGRSRPQRRRSNAASTS